MPDKLIAKTGCLVKSIFFQCPCNFLAHLAQSGIDPSLRKSMNPCLFFRIPLPFQVHKNKSCGIPQFVYKVPVPQNPFFGKSDISSLRCQGRQCKTEGVCAKFIHHLKGINNIPL